MPEYVENARTGYRFLKSKKSSQGHKQEIPQYDFHTASFVDSSEKSVEYTNSKGESLKGAPRLLKRRECRGRLAYDWPTWKKWAVLSVIFIIQVSMNFNASVYGNANSGIANQFGVSAQAARTGQAVFLVLYAIGSELWAPWSEELGRWPILQTSLFFVNIFQIPVSEAPNFASVVVGRCLGGLSSAGGSVTLGMVNDMYSVDEQGFAVNYIVLSSVGGSVVGPVVGAFIQAEMNWRWVFRISLFFGLFVQILHGFLVPETSPEILMMREARLRREQNRENVWAHKELEPTMTLSRCVDIWMRPFKMFATEPIVLWLSLLSGFSDALIFTFIEAFSPVFAQYNFSTIQQGLAFIPLLVGYFIAWVYYCPFIYWDRNNRRKNPGQVRPENRLLGLLFVVPFLSLGLFGFAWTSLGPKYVPWIAPMIFAALIGIANAAIYMSTIDYMIAAYGQYAASATGGNALARDALSGVAAYYSTPFYEHFHHYTLEYPSTILACIAFVFTVPVYIFYFYGEWFRERSKLAQTLQKNLHESRIEDMTETPREKSRITGDHLEDAESSDDGSTRIPSSTENNAYGEVRLQDPVNIHRGH